MSAGFSERLRACMDRGDLTVSNLAVWFDRPRSTVMTWVNGRVPLGPTGREALRLLELLEGAIKQRRGLPIPAAKRQYERPDYIRGIRDAVDIRAGRDGADLSGVRSSV